MSALYIMPKLHQSTIAYHKLQVAWTPLPPSPNTSSNIMPNKPRNYF